MWEKKVKKIIKLFTVLLLVSGALPSFGADSEKLHSWDNIRRNLFADRPIAESTDGFLQMDMPVRAEDAAIVPVAIRVQITQSPTRYVQKLYLLVDKNPSPIAGIFTFSPDSGRADIDTRIRLEEYTHVRAVAEMNDGKLYMVSRFVKASGGCSAPAGKDLDAAMANMGRMKFRLDGGMARLNAANGVQLMISHPNNSGMAMDQVTHLFVPAHFVRQVQVAYAGEPIMTADVDFSISENPSFHFYFTPHKAGELTADVVDSSDKHFHQALAVEPAATATP
jgi:sulfur-oxidizing protein SoxY